MVKACQVLGLNRSTVAARRKRADNDEPPRRSRLHAVQPRALSQQERAVVTALLHSEAHCDQAPAAVWKDNDWGQGSAVLKKALTAPPTTPSNLQTKTFLL